MSDFGIGDEPENPDGPGSPAWGEDSVTCSDDDDCHSGEVCEDSVCVMQRCGGNEYESVAPLGERRYFFRDREVAVADATAYDGGYWVDGYEGGSMAYPSGGGSWNMGESKLADVAGGNYLGEPPEVVAAAVTGSERVVVASGSRQVEIDVGFVPRAVAAGDVDRDHVEELIAIGSGNQVAVCHVPDDDCERYNFADGVTGVDVTAGDVDGDGYDEPVFAILVDGDSQILAWNMDAEITGQPAAISAAVSDEFVGIAAGDLDADGKAEVVGLVDGGWADWASDDLHIYSLAAGGVADLGTTETDSGSIDLTVTDTDDNRVDEVVVLRDDQKVDVLYQVSPGQLGSGHTATLSASSAPTRITTVDFDGDSPSGVLVEGPVLVPGEVVPTMVLYMPPYYRRRSGGVPWVWVGDSSNTGQGVSDTVSLSVGVTLGYEGGFPSVFEAELSATLGRELTLTNSTETTLGVGDQFNLEADPELYGEDYAAVVLSCGCFHSYTYQLDDPGNVSGGDGQKYVVLVPVGGQTTLWHSKRYNAMVDATGGTLPKVVVPHKVGDAKSYPTMAETAEGEPLAADDLLFSQPSTERVSDVGDIGWNLNRQEEQTNEVAAVTTLDIEGSVSVGGFTLGGSAGAGAGQGYSVSVGSYAEFLGGVPPIPDDPATPEDEYETYAYSFTPIVYRQHYEDSKGNDAAYYVLNYAVGF
ncbi:MAG TPA: VCBS repeat-containing protein [Kofleriaceae bacterium]|jgi:hypothetical protein